MRVVRHLPPGGFERQVGWEKKASDGHLDGLLRATLSAEAAGAGPKCPGLEGIRTFL